MRIYASGYRVDVCSYRINQRKRLMKLGRVNVLTLDQARKKATAYPGKVASNENPQRETDTARQLKTIDDLCDLYVEGHAKRKKKTWKNDESMLRRLIKPKLKGRYAVSISSADLESIHAAFGAEHPYGANNLLKVYRKMVNWAKVAGYLPKDYQSPTVGIVRFPERKRRRFVTPVEMPRHLASAADGPAQRRASESQMGGHRLGYGNAVYRPDQKWRAAARATERRGHCSFEGNSEDRWQPVHYL